MFVMKNGKLCFACGLAISHHSETSIECIFFFRGLRKTCGINVPFSM